MLVDGGWPGSHHQQELIKLAGLDNALDRVEVASLLDRGFRGMAKARQHWHARGGLVRDFGFLAADARHLHFLPLRLLTAGLLRAQLGVAVGTLRPDRGDLVA